MKVAQLCLTLCNSMDNSLPPLSMEFPWQEYWSEYAFSSPGSLPHPENEPGSPTLRASLIAQLVTNPPAMHKTWVQSLDWEDHLEKGKATHSGILAWRILQTSPMSCKESETTEWLSLSLSPSLQVDSLPSESPEKPYISSRQVQRSVALPYIERDGSNN